MDQFLTALRAGAEATRLRILALSAQGALTVSEFTTILGHSQPRVSRHLKLLCEAGLIDRLPEGNWAFYQLARNGMGGRLARQLVDGLPADDPTLCADRDRLVAVRHARAEAAAAYFRDNAARWDEIRSLHVDDREVEQVLLELLPPERIGELLDIGTGTGRILEVFGSRGVRGVGIDLSREMLAVARANLARAGLKDCYVRHGDMYRLPWPAAAFDAITIHQVLHFADQPAQAIAEAARVLKAGGRLVIADFAPHDLDRLRRDHAHRRLGFGDAEVAGWVRAVGLEPARPVQLPGEKLTVSLWAAERPAAGQGGTT
ncbi:MAG: ArsR/SmtB family transcription factor [Pseudomonadota bacterium]